MDDDEGLAHLVVAEVDLLHHLHQLQPHNQQQRHRRQTDDHVQAIYQAGHHHGVAVRYNEHGVLTEV